MASLVLGIVGFLLWVVASIPAVVTGHLALSRIKRSGGVEGGRGLAVAGLVLGYLQLAVAVPVLIGVLAFAASQGSTPSDGLGADACLLERRTITTAIQASEVTPEADQPTDFLDVESVFFAAPYATGDGGWAADRVDLELVSEADCPSI